MRKGRKLGVEYLKLTLESLNEPDERAGAMLSLRAIAEAYGGLGAVAAEVGIIRESLYRSVSPKGNPALKTLIAVLKTLNLCLCVVEAETAQKKRTKAKGAKRKAA